MSPLDPDLYRLPSHEHEAIFRQEIILEEGFDRALPWQHPTAYLLGGQPGAGKSHTGKTIAPFTVIDRESGHLHGGAIGFGSDKLRAHHPLYEVLQAIDDQTADFYTDTDARLWVDKTVDYAIEQRLNVVFDSTLSRPEVAQSIIERFHEAGYRVEVAFVAAPEPLSLLGNLQRYSDQAHQKGYGRICERASHDAAYAGVLLVADRIDASRLVDAVHVYRRGGERIYTNHLGTDGQWVRPAATRAAINAERGRVRNANETLQIGTDIYTLGPRLGDAHKRDLAEITSLVQPLLDPELRDASSPTPDIDDLRRLHALETNLAPDTAPVYAPEIHPRDSTLSEALERVRQLRREIEAERDYRPQQEQVVHVETEVDRTHEHGYEL